MEPWKYDIGTVLNVERNGEMVVVRVSGYVDKGDNTKPLLVNLRIAGGMAWGTRQAKILPEQIKSEDPGWYDRQREWWENNIKQTAEDIYAKMSPAEKERREAERKRHSRLSPLDRMIDSACGLD